MKDTREYTVLDYETFSEANLKQVGGWEYSVHPTTDILCVAWRRGTRATLQKAPVRTWSPLRDGTQLRGPLLELSHALASADRVIAHNAYFEQVITRNVLKRRYLPGLRPLPPKLWGCTAALAAALALPRNLEGAALALELPVEKDMAGRRLMLKWSKPRKPTKNNPSVRHTDPEELDALIRYCATDVEAETELFLRCPPLTKQERQVWLLDQTINLRGFLVDREMVSRVLELLPLAKDHSLKRVHEISDGFLKSTGQHTKLMEWLEEKGVYLPNLQKKMVEDTISEGLVEGDVLEMLEHRLSLAKTSTAKYDAFEMRSRHDGRIRDILVYHGAGPGRWTGSGIQPQNFPRGTLKLYEVETALGVLNV